MILDLKALSSENLIDGEADKTVASLQGPSLNAFFALGAGPRKALRAALSSLLSSNSGEAQRCEGLLHHTADCKLMVPAAIGDYTDFYVGIHHATAIGEQFRPDNPLLPNYKYVPIGYHGRASTIVASGTAIRRPNGHRKAPEELGVQSRHLLERVESESIGL